MMRDDDDGGGGGGGKMMGGGNINESFSFGNGFSITSCRIIL